MRAVDRGRICFASRLRWAVCGVWLWKDGFRRGRGFRDVCGAGAWGGVGRMELAMSDGFAAHARLCGGGDLGGPTFTPFTNSLVLLVPGWRVRAMLVSAEE